MADQPLMVQRAPQYPIPGHLQRAQTTPINRDQELLFSESKRITSPIPSRLPVPAYNGGSAYSTPMTITPSSTPPLVVNGVPLTSGTVLNRQPPRSTPSLAPSSSSTASASSLYPSCIALRDRLQGVPGFNHFLELTEKPNSNDPGATPPNEMDTLDLDVVSHLWRCFMLGPSLCCIYNALNPAKRLEINKDCTLADLKECKKAVYHFLVAIREILPPSKLFQISDLYNNNTNGIVKVIFLLTMLMKGRQYCHCVVGYS
jgi:cell division control protein 24